MGVGRSEDDQPEREREKGGVGTCAMSMAWLDCKSHSLHVLSHDAVRTLVPSCRQWQQVDETDKRQTDQQLNISSPMLTKIRLAPELDQPDKLLETRAIKAEQEITNSLHASSSQGLDQCATAEPWQWLVHSPAPPSSEPEQET